MDLRQSGSEPVPGFTACVDCGTPYDARGVCPDCEDYVRCTHCGGEGLCWDGSDPLGNCPDDMHNCHACGGSGRGKDQVIF